MNITPVMHNIISLIGCKFLKFNAIVIPDRKMNNSNAYPALRKMNGSRGYTQHWQERNVNRAMERVGVPIIQQYYKSNGVLKPKSAILKSVYGFIN
jgi:hypothetical protein